MSIDNLSSLVSFVVVALTIFVLLLARAVDRLVADTASLQHQLDSLREDYWQEHGGPAREQQMNEAITRWYGEACRREEGQRAVPE